MHVVGTAGHVDHGKSTLVVALTGIDPDRFEEEKRRGLTIDLGFAWCTLPSGAEIGIVDVPGHERFIRNMLAGVGSIDAALFVVAADEGWMPQSAEHLQILDFLDVRRGVVAITKADLADDATLELVRDDVRRHLAGTALAGAPIVAVSGTTRAGLDDLLAALDGVLGEAGAPPDHGRPRLFVDRSFTITGSGTVVTGTLTGGSLATGDIVTVLPSGRQARIRSLQTHREPVTTAVPGSRVAANLVGLERTDVGRGEVVVRDRFILTRRFAARLRAARDLGRGLSERGAYELYAGSAQCPCRLRFLEADGDLVPGATVLAEIYSSSAMPLVPGDRFVVRDVGRWETVAGGVVLDHDPPRLRRGDADAAERLRSREGLRGAALAVRVVSERGAVDAQELAALADAGAADVEALGSAPGVVRAGSFLVDRAAADDLRERAVAIVSEHHRARPLEPGMPAEALRGRLGLDPAPFDQLLELWSATEHVVREGAAVRLAQHGESLGPEDRSTADTALEKIRLAGPTPPELAAVGLSPGLAKALERAGEVVLVTPRIAYPADVWRDIERRVVDLIVEGGPATVAQVRDAIATSRKYAVPVLERLDSIGITRRRGDLRELGPRGKAMASEC